MSPGEFPGCSFSRLSSGTPTPRASGRVASSPPPRIRLSARDGKAGFADLSGAPATYVFADKAGGFSSGWTDCRSSPPYGRGWSCFGRQPARKRAGAVPVRERMVRLGL